MEKLLNKHSTLKYLVADRSRALELCLRPHSAVETAASGALAQLQPGD